IRAYDLVIQPAPDGLAFDQRRLERIAAAFLGRERAPVVRGEREVDVRALVEAVDVVSGSDAERLCAALAWDRSPLARARVVVDPAGSAKPVEVARALGVQPEGAIARRAALARLGFPGVVEDAPGAAAQVAAPASGGRASAIW